MNTRYFEIFLSRWGGLSLIGKIEIFDFVVQTGRDTTEKYFNEQND